MIPTARKLNTIYVRACLPGLVVAMSCQRMAETKPSNFSPMSFILFIAMADLYAVQCWRCATEYLRSVDKQY